MFARIATCCARTSPATVAGGGSGVTTADIGYPSSLRVSSSRLIAEISSSTPRNCPDVST